MMKQTFFIFACAFIFPEGLINSFRFQVLFKLVSLLINKNFFFYEFVQKIMSEYSESVGQYVVEMHILILFGRICMLVNLIPVSCHVFKRFQALQILRVQSQKPTHVVILEGRFLAHFIIRVVINSYCGSSMVVTNFYCGIGTVVFTPCVVLEQQYLLIV